MTNCIEIKANFNRSEKCSDTDFGKQKFCNASW